jgi:hypothetical protein
MPTGNTVDQRRAWPAAGGIASVIRRNVPAGVQVEDRPEPQRLNSATRYAPDVRAPNLFAVYNPFETLHPALLAEGWRPALSDRCERPAPPLYARSLDLDAMPRGERHIAQHDRIGLRAHRPEVYSRDRDAENLGHLRQSQRRTEAPADAAP